MRTVSIFKNGNNRAICFPHEPGGVGKTTPFSRSAGHPGNARPQYTFEVAKIRLMHFVLCRAGTDSSGCIAMHPGKIGMGLDRLITRQEDEAKLFEEGLFQ
ncbi:hypothetical protein [Leclercia adecarboxylata]|uniref:hypothetical protein n=1 Tax=Leclercia adecarboxylata TaxID=83655 RepID=UPI002E0E660C